MEEWNEEEGEWDRRVEKKEQAIRDIIEWDANDVECAKSKQDGVDRGINFVKDINDFCNDRLYPKETFLRKNWQEYLQNDWRSLYSVCMKHLSIPKGSDPREIWGRVIILAVRDKYQSMKCNMNNKIKSIYMRMRILFEYAKQYLLMQRPHNDYCNDLYF